MSNMRWWTMSLYPPPAASISGVRPPGQFLLITTRLPLLRHGLYLVAALATKPSHRCPGWAALDRRRPGAGLLCTAGIPEQTQRKSFSSAESGDVPLRLRKSKLCSHCHRVHPPGPCQHSRQERRPQEVATMRNDL